MKIKQTLQSVLPVCVINFIQNNRKKDTHPQIVYNLGIDVKEQPKVLFSYLSDYLFMEQWGNQYGTRHIECAAFVKALLNRGCRVDLTDCNNTDGIRSDYDYIFGFGKAFRMARKLNRNAKNVLYLTEKTPDFSHKKEKERIDYFYQRHKIKVDFSRSGLFFKDDDFINLDSCIMIGAQKDLQLLPSNISGFAINPTGLKNTDYDTTIKKNVETKKHFLWIGSKGAIHKGLDILLDVFAKHPTLTLHIVGLHWTDRKLMQRYMSKNTIDYGYMNIQSNEFLRIAEMCAFCISPSCSEAVSTSVITAMNHGLIPLVSQECSFEFEEIGEILTDFHVDYLESVIERWSIKSDDEIIDQMHKSYNFAINNFNISKYSRDISGIVESIIKK